MLRISKSHFLAVASSLSPLLQPLKSWREFLLLRDQASRKTESEATHRAERDNLQAHVKFLEKVIRDYHENTLPLVRLFGIGENAQVIASSSEQRNRLFELLQPSACAVPLVRLGSKNDGGYLVPENFVKVEACFSPGIGTVSDFELEIATKGIKTYLCDFSVEGPAAESNLFEFEKKYVSAETVFGTEWLGFSDWVIQNEPEAKNLILQMDIDGAEWHILENLEQLILEKFQTVIIEFHDFQLLMQRDPMSKILKTFEKLKEKFDVVHIHPNNFVGTFECEGYLIPRVFEATFYRRTENGIQPKLARIDNSLDSPNDTSRAEIELTNIWFPTK